MIAHHSDILNKTPDALAIIKREPREAFSESRTSPLGSLPVTYVLPEISSPSTDYVAPVSTPAPRVPAAARSLAPNHIPAWNTPTRASRSKSPRTQTSLKSRKPEEGTENALGARRKTQKQFTADLQREAEAASEKASTRKSESAGSALYIKRKTYLYDTIYKRS